MKHIMQWTSIVALILVASMSEAKTIRVTDLEGKMLPEFLGGQHQEWIVEFRRGDELPMTFSAEGDFFETRPAAPTPVLIKKDFWLKVDSQKGVLLSLDGNQFKPLPQVATGSLEVGTNADPGNGVANVIVVNLKAFQK